MFVNDLILNAYVKTTEIFICEKILTTSGNQIYFNMFDLSLPLSWIETTHNRITRLILTPGQMYS